MSGRLAAAQAGLGIITIPKELLPHGLFILDEAQGFPKLEDIEIALMKNDNKNNPAANQLMKQIVFNLETNPLLSNKQRKQI